MELDYPYTCPIIDKSIASLKSDIEIELSYILEECCPLINGEQKDNFINYHAQRLYERVEDNFEDVRYTNEAIRDAANKQIRCLEEELANAKEELAKAEAELDECRYTIEQLEANNKATD